MPKAHGGEFYTVAEAARLLEVSPSTIWRWIAAGRLPAYRVGPRSIRIRKGDLQAIITPARLQREKEVAAGVNRPRSPDHDHLSERDKPEDIWFGYDPERTREALRKSAGTLSLTQAERDALLARLRAEREQDSRGRPA